MNILQIYVHFLKIKPNCVHFFENDGHTCDLCSDFGIDSSLEKPEHQTTQYRTKFTHPADFNCALFSDYLKLNNPHTVYLLCVRCPLQEKCHNY